MSTLVCCHCLTVVGKAVEAPRCVCCGRDDWVVEMAGHMDDDVLDEARLHSHREWRARAVGDGERGADLSHRRRPRPSRPSRWPRRPA